MSNSDKQNLEDFFGKGAFRDRHGRVWVPEKGSSTTVDYVKDKITVTRDGKTRWSVFEDCRPPKPFRTITHHIVGLFKDHFSGTTDAGFRCHCGHKGGVQFTDYQAMTSPVAWALPSVVCDRVIAAWRAHTKDLAGVHPNAEDQIRDFFSRHPEQPGGPTVTTPRYSLTAIPLETPRPKSITISALVDEELRRTIVDYAGKLGIVVTPVESRWFDWLVTDCPTSLKSATPAAMREYLARLLYGDEGIAEETPPLELTNTPPSDSQVNFANDCANDPELTAKPINNDRPTRIILRSYAADDKPRIERLLGLARQLQIPVQLAGPWSCTAFPKGEEAHPALDVVFPEVLVHPRDVLIISEGNEYHDGNSEKRLFSPSLAEAENQLLWAAREDDQRFITGLIELLGLPAEASRGDIAAAVERSGTHYEALDVRVRDILGAVDGEETDKAAKRVMTDLAEWKRGQESWRNSTIALRQETAENQRKLLDILRAGTGQPSWERCISYAEARMKNAAQFEDEVAEALGLPTDSAKSHVVKWAKSHVGQNKYQTEKLAEALGYKSDDYCELLQQVQRVIREHQTLLSGEDRHHAEVRANNKDDLGAKLSAAEKERDVLKERLETAITAERQTIAQRIDLALTGNAVVTNLDTMLRAVGACREGRTGEASRSVYLRRDCVMLQDLIGQIADALDAPPGDCLIVTDDGSLNTALVDRVVGYFERLCTAAGFTEPPQGGWAQLLAEFERPR